MLVWNTNDYSVPLVGPLDSNTTVYSISGIVILVPDNWCILQMVYVPGSIFQTAMQQSSTHHWQWSTF